MTARILVVAATVLAVATVVAAEPVNLAEYARVTADGTDNTFFRLWPRDTEDGPFTVRDGQPETGWKVPRDGSAVLEIDFAPVLDRPPTIQSVTAFWGSRPATVLVEALDFCDGEIVGSGPWTNPDQPFTFPVPMSAYCLRIKVGGGGSPSLVELGVWGSPAAEVPALIGIEATEEATGIRVDWTPNDAARFVRIDYLRSADEAPSADSRIAVVSADRAWIGPVPALGDGLIGVTPLAADGTEGETVVVASPRAFAPLPWPNMGTIEGFYGTMWSDGERRAMMAQLARLGFGSYLYAPKWDLINREQWRVPYPDADVARFAALREFGERVGVRMVFGLSPAFDMVVDDPAERQILLDKLAPLVAAGFRDFEFGFDDIEFGLDLEVDGLLGAKHVDLTNWLKARLEEMAGGPVNIWFMPTPYSTARQTENFEHGTEYVDQVIALHPDIQVMWNGPDTFARTISAADLADVTARTGRKPLIWENMHCNDAGDAFIGKFYLAPMMNRAPDMVDAVAGFLTNPLIPGAADRLVYGSYSAYVDDPYAYDPATAMPGSVTWEATDPPDQDLALWWSEGWWGLGIIGPEGFSVSHNRPLDAACDAVEAAVVGGDLPTIANAAGNLLNVAARMSVARDELHHSGLAPDLVDDLWFPAERLIDDGNSVLYLLDWLAERLAGGSGEAAMDRATDELRDGLLHDRYETSLLRPFLLKTRLLRAGPGARGFVGPALPAFPTGDLVAHEEWSMETGAPGRIGVFGLRGARVDGSTIRWTPPHVGSYRAIVTAVTDAGWGREEWTLLARPSEAPADDDDDTGDDAESQDDDGGCGCA
jgi:hypothetical protein